MIHVPKELRVGRGKFTPNAELAFALDLDYKKLLLNCITLDGVIRRVRNYKRFNRMASLGELISCNAISRDMFDQAQDPDYTPDTPATPDSVENGKHKSNILPHNTLPSRTPLENGGYKSDNILPSRISSENGGNKSDNTLPNNTLPNTNTSAHESSIGGERELYDPSSGGERHSNPSGTVLHPSDHKDSRHQTTLRPSRLKRLQGENRSRLQELQEATEAL